MPSDVGLDRLRQVAAILAVALVIFSSSLRTSETSAHLASLNAAPTVRERVELLQIVPSTAADFPLAVSRARAFSGAGSSALAFVVGSAAAHAFTPLSSAAVSSFAVDCADAETPSVDAWHSGPRIQSAASCRVFSGLCAALRKYDPKFVAVLRPDAVLDADEFLRVSRGAKDGNIWGPLRLRRATDDEGKRWYPNKPYWPPHTDSSAIVFTADVASALCALHESPLPLKLHGPPEVFIGIVLSALEGLTWNDAELSRVADGACPKTLVAEGFRERDFEACAKRGEP